MARHSWLDRSLARCGLGRLGHQRTAYAGAGVSRLYNDWIFSVLRSADQELRYDLPQLRARSRDIGRNTAFGRRYLGMVAENVMGPTGMRLQAKVTSADGVRLDRETNNAIEAAWRRWSIPEFASVDGKLSWIEHQRLYARTWAQDGESLVRMVPGFGNAFGFSLQQLDPDQLDHRLYRERRRRNEIRAGVEIDDWGRPVAYWIWPEYPFAAHAPARDHLRIPASEIIHDYLIDRAGQMRGVPWFAPVLLDAKMFAGLMEAELVASRTAAAKMGFFRFREGHGAGDPNAAQQKVNLPVEADPGTFALLPHDLDFINWDPQHPPTAFAPYVKVVQRHIATGLEASYNILFNDLEGVNYSSLRGGLITERDVWKCLQALVALRFHRRVYLTWQKWALTSGVLDLPARNSARWQEHAWLPRGWEWVDPLKELAAHSEAIAQNLDSKSRICAARGLDYEDILLERRREKQLEQQYGLVPADDDDGGTIQLIGDDDDDDTEGAGPGSVVQGDGNPDSPERAFLGTGIRRRHGRNGRAHPRRDLVGVPG